jgi:threonine/homoserine/homoserine lactone efflux protein
MGGTIGDILAPAIGVAISPVQIIAVILILFSKRARSNGLAFLVGWVLSMAAACTVVMLVGSIADIDTSSGPSRGAAILRIVLGALLLFAAWRQWKKRPKEGEEPQMPKWMAGIEGFNAAKSFIMAVGLSVLNPKILILTVVAAMAIIQDTQESLGGAEPWIAMVVFVVVASSTVAAAVLTHLLGGKRAGDVLNSWKAWLTANNATVMFVLLLVFGVLVIGKGISSL